MKLKRIATQDEGNSNYPLPPDYFELTQDGQRLARLCGTRQWMLPTRDREQKKLAFRSSSIFFEQYYLFPDHDDDFNPLFHDMDPLPSPAGHQVIRDVWATTRLSITIAPRGYAKSKLSGADMIMRTVSWPAYSFFYATGSVDLAAGMGNLLKNQYQNNERLLVDWGPEYGGKLAPRRGEHPFSAEYMRINNGSSVRITSARSRQRGGRPTRYRLDDPEYDPTGSTSMAMMRAQMEQLLFRVIIPMVTQEATGVEWLATFVSKRHYAWHAMSAEEQPDGSFKAADPRFNLWHRLMIPALGEDPKTGEVVSCWREMWPGTKKDRMSMAQVDPAYYERVSLEEIREQIGAAAFNSEYMGKPGDPEDQYFGGLTKEKHGYWFEEVDEFLHDEPWRSMAKMCWREGEDTQKVPLKDFLSQCKVFITGDTSFTSGPGADPKACCCMAVDSNNTLFVLDLWAKRCPESHLILATFEMAAKWHAGTLCPEVVREGVSYYNGLDALIRTKASDVLGTTWLPRLWAVKPGMQAKVAKIAAISFRFDHAKIKFPLEKRLVGAWRWLFDQVEEFNPEAPDGGLQNDDCLDCVAMSNFVIKGRVARPAVEEVKKATIMERIQKGERVDETGVPLALHLDLSEVSAQELLDAAERILYAPSDRKRSCI